MKKEMIKQIELYMHHAINEGVDIPSLNIMPPCECHEIIQQICEDMITTIDPDYYDNEQEDISYAVQQWGYYPPS